jgi:hypothetical protein
MRPLTRTSGSIKTPNSVIFRTPVQANRTHNRELFVFDINDGWPANLIGLLHQLCNG